MQYIRIIHKSLEARRPYGRFFVGLKLKKGGEK